MALFGGPADGGETVFVLAGKIVDERSKDVGESAVCSEERIEVVWAEEFGDGEDEFGGEVVGRGHGEAV